VAILWKFKGIRIRKIVGAGWIQRSVGDCTSDKFSSGDKGLKQYIPITRNEETSLSVIAIFIHSSQKILTFPTGRPEFSLLGLSTATDLYTLNALNMLCPNTAVRDRNMLIKPETGC
jgi:hypothetical protein